MPTAVITESSENTMSITMICATTAASERAAASPSRSLVLALELSVDLERRLGDEEQAAEIRIRPRPETSTPRSVNSGVVSRTTHAMLSSSSRIRVTNAPNRPSRRALAPLLLRQLPGEDRDEDDVVDAEDDLEHGQREQSDPRVRVGDPVHVGSHCFGNGITPREAGRRGNLAGGGDPAPTA